mmetsp:Transcript_42200/g.90015  ORF Transcript_42200/g.90015 Transcript_42200/m.90015 type:complete len:200 (-) Transcript_42200:539-1138(-)
MGPYTCASLGLLLPRHLTMVGATDAALLQSRLAGLGRRTSCVADAPAGGSATLCVAVTVPDGLFLRAGASGPHVQLFGLPWWFVWRSCWCFECVGRPLPTRLPLNPCGTSVLGRAAILTERASAAEGRQRCLRWSRHCCRLRDLQAHRHVLHAAGHLGHRVCPSPPLRRQDIRQVPQGDQRALHRLRRRAARRRSLLPR